VITILELKRALRSLSAAEFEGLVDWIDGEVEEIRNRELHADGHRVERRSEEPLFMSFAEYMDFEETSPLRHEFINGAVHTVGGESLAHNRIVQALLVAFGVHLRVGNFEPFFLQVKLDIQLGSDRIVYYPDAMVSWRPEDGDEQVVRNPKLVIEILSKSTQHIDRREKAMTYQRVEAIEEYVLIAQKEPRVIMHRRGEGWRPMLYSGMDARVEFRSIGLQMPLAEIYEGTLPAPD